ncbi:oxygen-insensitive NAD(P)H nitroreductase [Oxalobacteraceae sp. CFBP 8755]|nr:oxygen-insensitive NAD(P)H nitroreductase [Oxalobacteraceae sp. CFBP 8761]MBD8633540.1 oxygen-insensitive NAD(P)H nitroreductase [Oxalobacteraceae sp. CFBP 8755]MBD8725235.1 oxygen-insensitive NAD(P)H nitroreductase [Oxalobacteraceae sp. CFBP 13708]
MDILSAAKKRHTAKAYDSARRIPEDVMQKVYDLLRNSASSVNSQPWHFIVANTPEGRARIAKATQGGYVYNAAKVNDASHVIVLCARVDMDESHMDALLEQEERDGRFRDAQARAGQDATRRGYVNQHRYGTKDVAQWLEKQVYLALGTALLGAATLEIDATPMEGFDQKILDAEFGLNEKGLTSLVLVSFGYSSPADFNAGLPKSRLTQEATFTFID